MAEEHNKTADDIISEQLEFFARNGSGCAFAAYAARDALQYEWAHMVLSTADAEAVDDVIAGAVADPSVSTLSLIFPEVQSMSALMELLPLLNREILHLHEIFPTEGNACYRFRARVGDDESLVEGFGPFHWMPVTRQAPHTAIAMRVGPRPDFEWFLQPPEEGLIHVADMDMKGLSRRALERMWSNSYTRTRGLLGQDPDDESAAKTTFILPHAYAEQISAQFDE